MASAVSKSQHSYQHHKVTTSRDFSDFVSYLTENLCVDFPMYLTSTASNLRPLASEQPRPHLRLLAASFYNQLLLTESIVDTNLLDLAIQMLLKILKAEQGVQKVSKKWLKGPKIMHNGSIW